MSTKPKPPPYPKPPRSPAEPPRPQPGKLKTRRPALGLGGCDCGPSRSRSECMGTGTHDRISPHQYQQCDRNDRDWSGLKQPPPDRQRDRMAKMLGAQLSLRVLQMIANGKFVETQVLRNFTRPASE